MEHRLRRIQPRGSAWPARALLLRGVYSPKPTRVHSQMTHCPNQQKRRPADHKGTPSRLDTYRTWRTHNDRYPTLPEHLWPIFPSRTRRMSIPASQSCHRLWIQRPGRFIQKAPSPSLARTSPTQTRGACTPDRPRSNPESTGPCDYTAWRSCFCWFPLRIPLPP